MEAGMTALTAAAAMATVIIEPEKRSPMMGSCSLQLDVTATDPDHPQKPLCCPWSPCEDLVPPQTRALPGAVHAAAPGDHSFLRCSAARCKFCSPGRSA